MAKRAAELLNRTALADALGVTRWTISRWEADGMPAAKKAGRGRETRFDLAKCRAWRDAADAAGAADDGDLGQSSRRARLRKDLAQAMEVEQRVAIKAGTLVKLADVEHRWKSVFIICRTKLLALPSKAKSRLPHLSLTDIRMIDDVVREVLEDLSRTDSSEFEEIDDLTEGRR